MARFKEHQGRLRIVSSVMDKDMVLKQVKAISFFRLKGTYDKGGFFHIIVDTFKDLDYNFIDGLQEACNRALIAFELYKNEDD